MRFGLVRRYGLAVVTAAILAASCDDNPLSFDVKKTTSLEVNPSAMIVPGGRTQKLEVRPVNDGREPTFVDVAWTVTNCGDAAAVTVAQDPDQLPAQPPGRLEVTAGTELGSNCVDVSGGGVSETVDVTVMADQVLIDSTPTLLRAGETGTVVPRIATQDSVTMTPFELGHVEFTSNDEAVATIDETGFVQTQLAGAALLEVTWIPGQTGITALSVEGMPSRSASQLLEVVATVPDSAYLDVGDTFGAFAFPDSTTGEVIVLDEFGNVNTNPDEITAIAAFSDNPAVATVDAEIATTEDPETGEISARAVMKVQILTGGIANISGTVTTTTGVFDWGPATVIGAAPVITAVTPNSGLAATEVVISGSGFVAAGLPTGVLVDGENVMVSALSDTEITATMPTLAAGTYDLTVSVAGVEADPASWTQTVGFGGGDDEPANDSEATAPVASFPMDFTATIGPTEAAIAFGHYDLYRVTLTAPGTINMTLSWPDASNDIDVYIWDATGVGGEPDGGFGTFPTGWACGAAGGTLGEPESTGDCSLPAGDYLIWIYDFGPGESLYTLEGTYTPD